MIARSTRSRCRDARNTRSPATGIGVESAVVSITVTTEPVACSRTTSPSASAVTSSPSPSRTQPHSTTVSTSHRTAGPSSAVIPTSDVTKYLPLAATETPMT